MGLHISKLACSRRKVALHVLVLALQIGLVALCSAGAQTQPYVDGRIHLDVIVTDAAGKPVSGLQSQDLRIFEDGAERQIVTFAGPDSHAQGQNVPTQMIIVIDSLNNGFMRQGLERFLRENNGRLGQLTTIAQLTPSGMKVLPSHRVTATRWPAS